MAARDDSAAADAADSPRDEHRYGIPDAGTLSDSDERSDVGEEVNTSESIQAVPYARGFRHQ